LKIELLDLTIRAFVAGYHDDGEDGLVRQAQTLVWRSAS